jgi:hypothetical protein
LSRRDISAGIRARQRSVKTDAETPEVPMGVPSHYITVEVPVSLDAEIEEQVRRLSQAAEEAGRPAFTKGRFIELALRDFVQTSPADILARDQSE